MPQATKFADKLRAARTKANLTRAALAEKARLSRMHVGRLEKGQQQPSLETAQRLAVALGVKLADFLA